MGKPLASWPSRVRRQYAAHNVLGNNRIRFQNSSKYYYREVVLEHLLNTAIAIFQSEKRSHSLIRDSAMTLNNKTPHTFNLMRLLRWGVHAFTIFIR